MNNQSHQMLAQHVADALKNVQKLLIAQLLDAKTTGQITSLLHLRVAHGLTISARALIEHEFVVTELESFDPAMIGTPCWAAQNFHAIETVIVRILRQAKEDDGLIEVELLEAAISLAHFAGLLVPSEFAAPDATSGGAS